MCCAPRRAADERPPADPRPQKLELERTGKPDEAALMPALLEELAQQEKAQAAATAEAEAAAAAAAP